jgi:hypothetical protein
MTLSGRVLILLPCPTPLPYSPALLPCLTSLPYSPALLPCPTPLPYCSVCRTNSPQRQSVHNLQPKPLLGNLKHECHLHEDCLIRLHLELPRTPGPVPSLFCRGHSAGSALPTQAQPYLAGLNCSPVTAAMPPRSGGWPTFHLFLSPLSQFPKSSMTSPGHL